MAIEPRLRPADRVQGVGAKKTIAHEINDLGQIAAVYWDEAGVGHGCVVDRTGTVLWNDFDVPGAIRTSVAERAGLEAHLQDTLASSSHDGGPASLPYAARHVFPARLPFRSREGVDVHVVHVIPVGGLRADLAPAAVRQP